MKWAIIDVGDSNEMFDLPNRVGVEVSPDSNVVYKFRYLNSLSARTRSFHLHCAEVDLERGSGRVVRVVLYPSDSAQGADSRMEDAVREAFKSDGRIDSKEQRFLSLIKKQVVASGIFGK